VKDDAKCSYREVFIADKIQGEEHSGCSEIKGEKDERRKRSRMNGDSSRGLVGHLSKPRLLRGKKNGCLQRLGKDQGGDFLGSLPGKRDPGKEAHAKSAAGTSTRERERGFGSRHIRFGH